MRNAAPVTIPETRAGVRGVSTPWPLLLPLLIACITFAAFLPALGNRIPVWDDDWTITRNIYIQGLTRENVTWMFTHYLMGHYQPLALLTLAIDYQIWGMEGFGFHLTNLLLHCANAVLVYLIAQRLLILASPVAAPPQGPDEHWEPSANSTFMLAAAIAALLFAIHPLRVESVAWATQRRDVLSAFFYLLAVLIYLRGRLSPSLRLSVSHSSLPRAYMLGVIAAAALSLLAKSIAVTLVPVLLVLDVYPLSRWAPSQNRPIRGAIGLLLEKLPLLLLSGLMLVVATRAQAERQAWAGLPTAGRLLHIEAALFSLSFYLWKTLLPIGLSPLYEMPQTPGQVDLRFVVAGLIVLLSGPAVLIWRKRWGAFMSAWACYLILLVPVLGLFHDWPQIAADRYTYLACLGWPICVASLCGAAFSRCYIGTRAGRMPAPQGERSVPPEPVAAPPRGGRSSASSTIAATAAVIAALGILTFQQTKVWHDDRALWEHVLAIEPDAPMALGNMGCELLMEGQAVQAERYLRRSLDLRPDHPKNTANLGLALARQNRHDEALDLFNRSLALAENAAAWAGIAYEHARRGDVTQAEQAIRRSLAFEPDELDSHALLATILLRSGRPEQAAEAFETLARRHEMVGNPQQAIAQARQACAAANQTSNQELRTRCHQTLTRLNRLASTP